MPWPGGVHDTATGSHPPIQCDQDTATPFRLPADDLW